MRYFTGIQTLTELKVLYKKLAFVHHPDRGGNLETMKHINNEYDQLFNTLKAAYNDTQPEDRQMHEVPEQYREVILNVMDLEGVEIELIGSWIWVSGNTKEYKDVFKANGFKWASKKIMWYWRPEEYKSYSRKTKSINDIRNKYGSEKIKTNKSNVLGS